MAHKLKLGAWVRGNGVPWVWDPKSPGHNQCTLTQIVRQAPDSSVGRRSTKTVSRRHQRTLTEMGVVSVERRDGSRRNTRMRSRRNTQVTLTQIARAKLRRVSLRAVKRRDQLIKQHRVDQAQTKKFERKYIAEPEPIAVDFPVHFVFDDDTTEESVADMHERMFVFGMYTAEERQILFRGGPPENDSQFAVRCMCRKCFEPTLIGKARHA